jgi:hypothetical protein
MLQKTTELWQKRKMLMFTLTQAAVVVLIWGVLVVIGTVTNVFRLLKNCKKIATVCLIFGIISSAFMIPYMDYRVTNDIGTFLHMGLAIADAIVISFMPINVVSILQSNFAKSR